MDKAETNNQPPSNGYTYKATWGFSFQYQDITASEFRLICLLPGKTSAINCELVTVCLENHPKYRAISYAWGDVDDTVDILVNDRLVTVTLSLRDVLEAIREEDEVALLWADALCINQKNKLEQSHQVQLMTSIYGEADSVIVWLGPETHDSGLAVDLLQQVSEVADQPEAMGHLITSRHWRNHFTALVNLFERDYWRRLWVVQEVLKARSAKVHCGTTSLPWETYTSASEAFKRHEGQLNRSFPAQLLVSQQHKSYMEVLSSLGPGSIHDLRSLEKSEAYSFLKVLNAYRTKHASDPRDKVFGVLGILPEEFRYEFRPNYSASLKEVYTNVVDFLLRTTGRLDVICEAIYFPLHISTANLPSWVPDWSHIPQMRALGLRFNFSASQDTSADFMFQEGSRRTKLKISIITLGSLHRRGIAVDALYGLDDLLMAFLHWRNILLQMREMYNRTYARLMNVAFCRTLCLGQKTEWEPEEWVKVCYHVFSSLIHDRLPYIRLDEELCRYVDLNVGLLPSERRRVVEENCGTRMMSRCFFVTYEGLIGMGTGYMDRDDIVCVPLGCSTPVLLRPEANGEYRYVGDAYVDLYMQGKAVDELNDGTRMLQECVLC